MQLNRGFDGFLKVRDAAEFLGVSLGTLRNWDRCGKVKAIRHPVNRYRLYRQTDLEALLCSVEMCAEPVQSALFSPVEVQRPSAPPLPREKDTQTAEVLGGFALNRVHLMDCIEGMQRLPSQCVDLAIADPPYNLSKGGEWKWDNSVRLPGFGGNWSKVMAQWDNMTLSDYFAFTTAWLAQLKRLVRPTGSLWIHGTYHNIGIINFALQCLGIEIINEVIWYKRNSFPNLSGRRLTASHETILWAHTGKKRDYWFDYNAAKKLACPEDALKAPGKQMRTVWDIPNNKEPDEIRQGKHPTQKPLRLLRRMLALSARPGQLCLVPFAGVGSECVAAKQAGLHFLGFEIEQQYVTVCERRLSRFAEHPLNTPARVHAAPSVRSFESAPVVSDRNRDLMRVDSRSIPSLLKWTGSKRSQAQAIAQMVPQHRTYYEPFIGSGAVLFLVGRAGSVAGDMYRPLIELWVMVRDQPTVIAGNYDQQWQALQRHLPEYFYEVRARFNREPNPLDLNFLMRTCVNGIIRFNGQGEFNNSFHLSRPGMDPARFRDVVRAWAERIQGVRFVCQDYAETVSEAGPADFVYLDPPYARSRQRYAADLDLERFFVALEGLNRRGVRWALSFDGYRGETDMVVPLPKGLYQRQLMLPSGHSAVRKVLGGKNEMVIESLYLNY